MLKLIVINSDIWEGITQEIEWKITLNHLPIIEGHRHGVFQPNVKVVREKPNNLSVSIAIFFFFSNSVEVNAVHRLLTSN